MLCICLLRHLLFDNGALRDCRPPADQELSLPSVIQDSLESRQETIDSTKVANSMEFIFVRAVWKLGDVDSQEIRDQ